MSMMDSARMRILKHIASSQEDLPVTVLLEQLVFTKEPNLERLKVLGRGKHIGEYRDNVVPAVPCVLLDSGDERSPIRPWNEMQRAVGNDQIEVLLKVVASHILDFGMDTDRSLVRRPR
jgi:hypothetical protein